MHNYLIVIVIGRDFIITSLLTMINLLILGNKDRYERHQSFELNFDFNYATV